VIEEYFLGGGLTLVEAVTVRAYVSGLSLEGVRKILEEMGLG